MKGVFSDKARDGMRSWPGWIFVVSAGALWGLPRAPHFHVDLPYIHHLGGVALVVWYFGLGFFSLGLYIIMMECLHVGAFRIRGLYAYLIGGGALILAGGCGWLYLMLLGMSVYIS
jgi:hypothetical protein